MSPAASVWHVTWEFPPLVYGGLARHAFALTAAQAAAGAAVTVVTSAEDVTRPSAPTLPEAGWAGPVAVLRATRTSPRLPWTDLIGAARQLEDALVSVAMLAASAIGEDGPGLPEVVHAHDWTAAGAATTLATGLGVPLVLTVHATESGRRAGRVGPSDGGGPAPALVHGIERAAVQDADAVVVCSHAMAAEVVTALGADPSRVHVIPNAVDPAAWAVSPTTAQTARAHWLTASAADAAGPLVVSAGRLEWEKGFSTLIRALPQVVGAFPGVRLVLAGRGTYEQVLRDLVAEVGVEEHVVRPGWLEPAELAELYAAADAVVVPSRYEPSGLVAREAQAAGALVVATSVGGLTDVVRDGETGRLFAPGDVDGLAAVLREVLSDPAASRRLADAGAAAVRTRTWADVAADTAAVYTAATLPARTPMC